MEGTEQGSSHPGLLRTDVLAVGELASTSSVLPHGDSGGT